MGIACCALTCWQVDEGGGAFYGPKIDLKIRDAIGRTWQCSTVQADFNLPDRFNLEYIDRYRLLARLGRELKCVGLETRGCACCPGGVHGQYRNSFFGCVIGVPAIWNVQYLDLA